MSTQSHVAFVSGGGRGIGQAVAQALAAAGVGVVVNDRDRVRAEATVAEIERAGGSATAAVGDVSKGADAARCVTACLEWGGRLDYAYNNAAVPGVIAPAGDYPPETFWRVLQVNVGGVLACMQAEVAIMRQHGSGSIVNAASAAVFGGVRGSSAYAASKHAVVGLTKSAALDHAADGIRVNAVAPGLVDTGFVRDMDIERFARAHPIGRGANPAEIAAAVCWLLSDASAFVTGSVLSVDGGLSAEVSGALSSPLSPA
jgi:NAD(P)-dependent dehydrogenase (short-subunit alcohol dehydrogenase family)